MKDAIRQYIAAGDELAAQIKDYCQDTSIDLDNRWEIFRMSGKILSSRFHSGKLLHLDCLYDELIMIEEPPFYVQRGQTLETPYIVDTLQTTQAKKEVYGMSQVSRECIENLNLDTLKEEILCKFIWSYRYDW
jgi:hypothetical protein